MSWIKGILPRSLFGRALMIIVTPMIVIQLVAGWFFFDRHYETVRRRLATGVVGDVLLAAALAERAQDPAGRSAALAMAGRETGLRFHFQAGAPLPAAHRTSIEIISVHAALGRALDERGVEAYVIDTRSMARTVLLWLKLPDGVLRTDIPRERVFLSTAFLWIAWMTGSSIVLGLVAAIFMRNQVRPIRRLAAAVDAFGKGRSVEDFRAAGASEVRLAAHAFRLMRDRIQRQIQQRTDLLAGVSHDLRTPLTRMKLELALLGDNDDVQALRQDVEEMERMLEAYLAFARGEGAEESVPTELDVLVEEVAGSARRAGATVETAAATGLVLPLRRDAFRRALANLVSNAARYGHGHVWISARCSANAVEILIDDDGPGIPYDRREDVFRPFVRLESSRNVSTGGIGLGLSIARDVVAVHGGSIRLADSPHGGLRAAVRLPL